MLIEFSCANFKCFADEARLQLTPSPLAQHPNHVVAVTDKLSALRTVGIYGANASGKTKLVEAIKFAQRLVVSPPRSGAALPYHPFALSRKSAGLGSRFEFIFSFREEIYVYGFVANANHIQEEWLFVRMKSQEKKCFERITTNNKVSVEIGPGLARKGTSDFRRYTDLVKATGGNQLFLNRLDDFQSERPHAVVSWFTHALTVIDASSNYAPLELRAHKEQDFITFLGKYLKSSYTGIDSIATKAEEFDVAKQLPGFPADKFEELVAPLRSDPQKSLVIQQGEDLLKVSAVDGKVLAIRLQAVHKGADGKSVHLGFEDESAGTQRLVNLLPALYDLQYSERTYVVDELDRKLHPLLTRNLIRTFLESQACRKGQLIFTTHETNLLDQEILRRDEIWFVEKDNKKGSSALYPLSDFDVRHDLRVEKGYLNGRFGGIPFFSAGNLFEEGASCGANVKKKKVAG